MHDTKNLYEAKVTCPVCCESWKVKYENKACLKFFVKCKSCKECFAHKNSKNE